MIRFVVVLMGCALLVACASSTQRGGGDVDAAAEPDGALVDATAIDAVPLHPFGEPCLDNDECDSGVCIFVGTGGRCTRLCDSDCPADWGCFGVIDVIDPGQVDNVCVPVIDQLCSACSGDSECTQLGMDRCLAYPDGDKYCSRDCRTVGCPSGYACTDLTIAGAPARQCVPQSGACDCDATNAGMMETCTITTPFATTCAGMRTCTGAAGWGGCQPPAITDDPDGAYLDGNCDGIDGDVGRGVFVAGGGSNTPTCGLTPTTPCQTISAGIIRAASTGRNHVFVQAGTYNEVVVLVNGVNVWGGYDFGWQRASYATPGHVVTITGGLDNGAGGDGEYLAVRAHDLIVPVTMGDLVIAAPAAVGNLGGNGRSSYAVHVDSATLNLQRVRIVGGNGADGAVGTNGTDAVIVDAQSYMTGGRGGNDGEFNSSCDITSRGAGGTAGTNTCTSSPSSRFTNAGAGGAGGTMDTSCGFTGVCAAFGNCDSRPGDAGAAAAYRNGSFGAPGLGGSGVVACGPTTSGGPGEVGNGLRGSRQSGATVSNGYWYGKPGTAGMTGDNGSGGGGGGGAGGCDVGTDSYGAGGGGGGAGGCAARSGGGGGGGGGASIGVLAVGGSTVTIATCELSRGNGGAGGAGGTGGRGQTGGNGNSGGSVTASQGATPGSGGNGSHGGHGGGGGGGQGGRAIGIASTPGSTVSQDCAITGGSFGSGGAGGVHAPSAPIRDGNDGEGGANGTLDTIRTCASTSAC